MAKKRKISAVKTVILSIFSIFLGILVGFVANIYFTLPDSYTIPSKVSQQSSVASTSGIDTEVVSSSDLSIHFLELGNKYTGDCTLIKVGDVEILIDAGSKTSSISYIKEYIDQYCTDGVLEYVIVTHAHEDHFAGFATSSFSESLFYYYEIGTIIDFSNTNKSLVNKMYSYYINNRDASGATHYTALECVNEKNGAQKTYYLNEEKTISFEVLYQKYYETSSSTENDYSVCIEINENGRYYLFTGDLEEDGELSLIEKNTLHTVELYKAGHHGSKTSSTTALIEVIQPKIVCVCCCAGSSEYTSTSANQFPTQTFIDNIYGTALKYNYTTKIFVTTLCLDYSSNSFTSFNGTIVVCATSGSDVTVYCSNDATELSETEWFKANRTYPESSSA